MRLIHRLTTSRRVLLPALAAALLFLLGSPPAHAADSPSACALRGTTGWMDEGHETDYSVFQRPVGAVRVAMVFVDFPDARAAEAPSEDSAQITPGA